MEQEAPWHIGVLPGFFRGCGGKEIFMEALSAINFLLAALFAACYCYQAVFLGARLLRKRRTFTARKLCRYAVLIAARNESAVIAQLLESIPAAGLSPGPAGHLCGGGQLHRRHSLHCQRAWRAGV